MDKHARKLPQRVVEITLPEPYDPFHITAWLNFPPQVGKDLLSGDEAKARGALAQIVRDHDLVDFDGEPMPASSEPAFWDDMPNDLALVIISSINARIGRLDPTKSGR